MNSLRTVSFVTNLDLLGFIIRAAVRNRPNRSNRSGVRCHPSYLLSSLILFFIQVPKTNQYIHTKG